MTMLVRKLGKLVYSGQKFRVHVVVGRDQGGRLVGGRHKEGSRGKYFQTNDMKVYRREHAYLREEEITPEKLKTFRGLFRFQFDLITISDFVLQASREVHDRVGKLRPQVVEQDGIPFIVWAVSFRFLATGEPRLQGEWGGPGNDVTGTHQ